MKVKIKRGIGVPFGGRTFDAKPVYYGPEYPEEDKRGKLSYYAVTVGEQKLGQIKGALLTNPRVYSYAPDEVEIVDDGGK